MSKSKSEAIPFDKLLADSGCVCVGALRLVIVNALDIVYSKGLGGPATTHGIDLVLEYVENGIKKLSTEESANAKLRSKILVNGYESDLLKLHQLRLYVQSLPEQTWVNVLITTSPEEYDVCQLNCP